MGRPNRLAIDCMHLGRLVVVTALCSLAASGNVSLMVDCVRAFTGSQPQNRFFSEIPEPSYPDATQELEELAAEDSDLLLGKPGVPKRGESRSKPSAAVAVRQLLGPSSAEHPQLAACIGPAGE